MIAAGGAGRRMGGSRKQYLTLAGEPLLVHSIRPFLAHPAVASVVVALPPEDAAAPPDWLVRLDPRVVIVPGGEERGDSVRRGLARVPADADVVLIHDAARPLVDRATIDRVLAAVRPGVGAVPAVAVGDTIKEVDEEGRVVATPDRRRLRRAQTPQGFPCGLISDAYRRAAADGVVATDDAALVERYNGTVVVVEGSAENIKVTSPADLAVAEALLVRRRR
ncbi:MAG: 2-C-methyl-D-erythritol 4-phosphate cytidylyltransferase [Gemmatimonadetes bacterium]|nr:2-C-methyl-D-erythritol 4-phosphate cytidylyltransferase [Gemmatimonadota bacterium]